MENLLELENKLIEGSGVNQEAKEVIAKFKAKVAETLKSVRFKSQYNSITEILVKKYKLDNIDDLDFPDFSEKTEFISKAVRGNVQKADENVLGYKEAQKIVERAFGDL